MQSRTLRRRLRQYLGHAPQLHNAARNCTLFNHRGESITIAIVHGMSACQHVSMSACSSQGKVPHTRSMPAPTRTRTPVGAFVCIVRLCIHARHALRGHCDRHGTPDCTRVYCIHSRSPLQLRAIQLANFFLVPEAIALAFFNSTALAWCGNTRVPIACACVRVRACGVCVCVCVSCVCRVQLC